jgi:hypothetical protein
MALVVYLNLYIFNYFYSSNSEDEAHDSFAADVMLMRRGSVNLAASIGMHALSDYVGLLLSFDLIVFGFPFSCM